jgi:hypothetical protein
VAQGHGWPQAHAVRVLIHPYSMQLKTLGKVGQLSRIPRVLNRLKQNPNPKSTGKKKKPHPNTNTNTNTNP